MHILFRTRLNPQKNNGLELLEPVGQRLNKEFEYLVYKELLI